jgi:hypothetical protein
MSALWFVLGTVQPEQYIIIKYKLIQIPLYRIQICLGIYFKLLKHCAVHQSRAFVQCTRIMALTLFSVTHWVKFNIFCKGITELNFKLKCFVSGLFAVFAIFIVLACAKLRIFTCNFNVLLPACYFSFMLYTVCLLIIYSISCLHGMKHGLLSMVYSDFCMLYFLTGVWNPFEFSVSVSYQHFIHFQRWHPVCVTYNQVVVHISVQLGCHMCMFYICVCEHDAIKGVCLHGLVK